MSEGPSVLVAGLNRTNRNLMAAMVRATGCDPVVSSDFDETANLLVTSQIDLALFDLTTPGLFASRWASDLRLPPRVGILTRQLDASRIGAADGVAVTPLSAPIGPAAIRALLDTCRGAKPAASKPPCGLLDPRALDDLRRLGGQGFVDDVIAQFLSDAAPLLANLTKAQSTGDVALFQDELHALRSGAANIGARHIYDFCIEWRAISPEDLSTLGPAHIARLRHDIDALRADTERASEAA